MSNTLKVVIVNWNLKDDTQACIQSLLQAGFSPEQIILVDNGSTDGSVKLMREEFGDRLTIIHNETNLGFASACNQGIHRALEDQQDWVLILNNDTIVAPNLLEVASRILERDLRFAILGPMVLSASQPDKILYLGDTLIPGTLITINRYRCRRYKPEFTEILPVDFICGCAMFVHKDVFNSIGLLDERLEMYGEEIDFCWRAQKAGYLIGSITEAKVWHKLSLSAKKVKSKSRYLRIRNQNRFYKKYAMGNQLPIMFLFSILRTAYLLISDITHLEFRLLNPTVKGWIDGWRGSSASRTLT